MNTTSCTEYIPNDIIDQLHHILEREEIKEKEKLPEKLKSDEKSQDKNETECHKGEVTEKGLRLRTPMISDNTVLLWENLAP